MVWFGGRVTMITVLALFISEEDARIRMLIVAVAVSVTMFWEYWHIYWICGADLTLRLLQAPIYLTKWVTGSNLNGAFEPSGREIWVGDVWAVAVFHLLKFLCNIFSIFFAIRHERNRLVFAIAITLIVLRPLETYFLTSALKNTVDHNVFDIHASFSNFTTVVAYIMVYNWMQHWSYSYLREEKLLTFTKNGKIFGTKAKDLLLLVIPQLIPASNDLLLFLRKAWVACINRTDPTQNVDPSVIVLWIIHATVTLVFQIGIVMLVYGSQRGRISLMKVGYIIFTISSAIGPSLAIIERNKGINEGVFKKYLAVLLGLLAFRYFMTLVILLRIWELADTKGQKWLLREAKIYRNKSIHIYNAQKLGSGFFGEVFKGETAERNWTFGRNFGKIEKQIVAVKFFPNSTSQIPLKEIRNELKTLIKRLPKGGHANVVRLVGLYLDEKDVLKLGIILEHCENGSLLQKLLQIKEKYVVSANVAKQLAYWANQIIEGMKLLASLNIIHGDLAARNILLDKNLCCKITDFGMSQKLYEYQTYVSGGAGVFPWRWCAPECLSTLNVSLKTDVWSFGVLLWEIFSLGDVPYCEREWTSDFAHFLQSGNRLEKPLYMSLDMYENVALKCWELESDKRPSFQELPSLLNEILYVNVD